MTRILIADDHPLFRAALTQALRELVPGASLVEAATLDAVHAWLEANPDTDLVLLDLHMPGSHGLAGLASVRCRHPAVAVAMVSANDDPAVIARAMDFGAQAFIPKSAAPAEIAAALQAVFACQTWVPPAAQLRAGESRADKDLSRRLGSLTPQQFRVLELVAQGRLNKQIADVLGIQERTVKAHLQAIFEKLGARNRTQAGVFLRQLELTDPTRQVEAV
ncbi:MAG: response regulator transcription factor [Xanthomonadales bacterium]|nr:Response regulator UvrY [Xanthomonadales bacterium]MCC6591807.1 response regulator transcription factor [Xanthomonadales bacterium]MCE7931031.1 DNA-binding response regulator [Xanthomonadales bacterium PRO6]